MSAGRDEIKRLKRIYQQINHFNPVWGWPDGWVAWWVAGLSLQPNLVVARNDVETELAIQ